MKGTSQCLVTKLCENLIPAKKKKTKEYIQRELKTIKSVCAHLDIWSSKKLDGCLGVSVAGMKSDFSLFKAYFACRNMKRRHTGLAILRIYEEIIQWGLQNKVLYRKIDKVTKT